LLARIIQQAGDAATAPLRVGAYVESVQPFPVGFMGVEESAIDHIVEGAGMLFIEVIADGGGHAHDLVAVRDHELSLRKNADVVEVMRCPEKGIFCEGREHHFLQRLQLGGMHGLGGLHRQPICCCF
jgi:hypothetical protein